MNFNYFFRVVALAATFYAHDHGFPFCGDEGEFIGEGVEE